MGFSDVERDIAEGSGFSQPQENARKAEKVTNGKDEERFAIQISRSSDISATDSNLNSSGDHGDPVSANNCSCVPDSDFSRTILDPENQIPMTEISNERSLQQILQPHPELPKPEPPRGFGVFPEEFVQLSRSSSENFSFEVRNFFRQSGNAIAKRLLSLQENRRGGGGEADSKASAESDVTEFKISGLKVFVKLKSEDEINGRITFFSRSNCRDSAAVRSFFRQRGINFVEINIDVFPAREKELIQRTGSSQVPQIFFNDKLFGGLIALNSLRNSGEFDRRMKSMLSEKCSGDFPVPPVYGFDDEGKEEEAMDEMIGFVRVLRQKLPIKDRLMKMKIVKNCFSGGEVVEILVDHFDCGRKKAVEIGKKLAKRHFIHHVFGGNDFEDGKNHIYRFLEHEPYIPKCYNYRGCTNDSEPKSAATVSNKLYKIMSAILESYASEDHSLVDYVAISRSEEFRRYLNLVQDLQRLNLHELSTNEKLAFFMNLYNAMVIHALIRIGFPEGVIERRSFFSDFQYIVGGNSYSLSNIRNGILRGGRRPSIALISAFTDGNKRHELALPKANPLVHFGLCDGTRSSPTVRFFAPEGIEAELKRAAREFFQNGGIEVDLDKRTVYLSQIMKWYSSDFGQEKEMLKWIIGYIDANKAGLLTHLLGDGGYVNVVHQDFDWSINT